MEGLIALGVSLASVQPASPLRAEGLPLVAADTVKVPLPSGFSYPRLRRLLGVLRPRTDTAEAAADETSLQIAGLVIDETATKAGRDFFDVFHGAWSPPPNFRNHTIQIQEQPLPTLGTRVVVLLDGEPLLQLQLQPRYEFIEEVAGQAATYVATEIERRAPRAGQEAAGSPGGGGGR